MSTKTTIPEIAAAVTQEQLLERAMADACESMLAAHVVGFSVAEAIRRLDQARRFFETAKANQR